MDIAVGTVGKEWPPVEVQPLAVHLVGGTEFMGGKVCTFAPSLLYVHITEPNPTNPMCLNTGQNFRAVGPGCVGQDEEEEALKVDTAKLLHPLLDKIGQMPLLALHLVIVGGQQPNRCGKCACLGMSSE